MQFKI